MRKPKAVNPPLTIFLQVGDIEEDCTFDECREEVTWCWDRIFDTDIEYRLVRPSKHKPRKVAQS
jgi:hypothetical protein